MDEPQPGDGDPISYLVLEQGTPVRSSDDVELGTVWRIHGSERDDVFAGIEVRLRGDHEVFAAAELVASIAARCVRLAVDAQTARSLPRPTTNPAAYRADPSAPGWKPER